MPTINFVGLWLKIQIFPFPRFGNFQIFSYIEMYPSLWLDYGVQLTYDFKFHLTRVVYSQPVRKNRNQSVLITSKNLDEKRGAAVPPRRIVRDFGATQRTGRLLVEPGGHAVFAENVPALQQHWRAVRVVADRTLLARLLDLLLAGRRSDRLKERTVFWRPNRRFFFFL